MSRNVYPASHSAVTFLANADQAQRTAMPSERLATPEQQLLAAEKQLKQSNHAIGEMNKKLQSELKSRTQLVQERNAIAGELASA
jgi:hypothetical protein